MLDMGIKRIAGKVKKWHKRGKGKRSALLLTFDGKEEIPMKHWAFCEEMDYGVLLLSAIVHYKPEHAEWHDVLICALNKWNDKRKRQDNEAGNDERTESQGAE